MHCMSTSCKSTVSCTCCRAGPPLLVLAARSLVLWSVHLGTGLPHRVSRAPFTFLVNIMVPGNPPWSLCMSWAAHTRPGTAGAPVEAAGGAGAQTLLDRAGTPPQGLGEPPDGSGGFSSCSNTSRSNSGLLAGVGGPLAGGEGAPADPGARHARPSLLDSPFDLALARCVAPRVEVDALRIPSKLMRKNVQLLRRRLGIFLTHSNDDMAGKGIWACSLYHLARCLQEQAFSVSALMPYCTDPGSWWAVTGARRSRGATTHSSSYRASARAAGSSSSPSARRPACSATSSPRATSSAPRLPFASDSVTRGHGAISRVP